MRAERNAADIRDLWRSASRGGVRIARVAHVTSGYSPAQVRKAILTRRAELGGLSWQKFGREIGVSGAMLNAVARGKKKPSAKVLRAFGFPVPRVVAVPDGYGVGECCAKCGEVHTTKRCTTATKPKPQVRLWREMSVSELRAAFENRE